MNIGQYKVETVYASEVQSIRDILKCLFHTIISHRAISVKTPSFEDCKTIDISYMKSGDEGTDTQVDAQVESVCQ